MTIPGGIQQLSVPGFVQGGGGHVVNPQVGGFERGMQTLLQAIADRKRQELEEAKFEAQQKQQAQAVEATEALGLMVQRVAANALPGGVPTMGVPNVGPMGGVLPPAIFGSMAENPYRAAVNQIAGQPQGLRSLGKEAGSWLSNIEQERNRLAKEKEAKGPARNAQLFADTEGWAMSFDKEAQSAQYVLDPQGNRIRLRDANRSRPVLLGKGFDTKTGKPGAMFIDGNGNTMVKPFPEGWVLQGQATPDAFKALNRYTAGLAAFKNLKANGMPVLSENVMTRLAETVKARGTAGTVGDLMANKMLTADERNAVEAWSSLLAAKTYKESGAAVTVSEFLRNINNFIPTWMDRQNDAKTHAMSRKINTLVEGLRNDETQARIAGLLFNQQPEDMNQFLIDPTTGMDTSGFTEVPGQ